MFHFQKQNDADFGTEDEMVERALKESKEEYDKQLYLSKLEKKCKIYQTQIKSLKSNLAEKTEEVEKLKKDNAELISKQLSSNPNENIFKVKSEELKRNEEKKEIFPKDIKRINFITSNDSSDIKKAYCTFYDLRQEKEKAEKRINELNDKILQKDKEYTLLLDKNSELTKQNRGLSNENKQLKEANTSLSLGIERLEEENKNRIQEKKLFEEMESKYGKLVESNKRLLIFNNIMYMKDELNKEEKKIIEEDLKEKGKFLKEKFRGLLGRLNESRKNEKEAKEQCIKKYIESSEEIMKLRERVEELEKKLKRKENEELLGKKRNLDGNDEDSE
ncbi:MAG: hypothetical protein MJ252_24535 [archaeon]|nr:hypothetical protein [archaeon]